MASILPKSVCNSENRKLRAYSVESSLRKEGKNNTSSVWLSSHSKVRTPNITLAGLYLHLLSEAIVPIQLWTAKGISNFITYIANIAKHLNW